MPEFQKRGASAIKPGGGNGATNDIAIMRPPGRAPILLAIYSVGSTATADDRAGGERRSGLTKLVAEFRS